MENEVYPECKTAKLAYYFSYVPLIGIVLYGVLSILAMYIISKRGKTGLNNLTKGAIVILITNSLCIITFYVFWLQPIPSEEYDPILSQNWIGNKYRTWNVFKKPQKSGLWKSFRGKVVLQTQDYLNGKRHGKNLQYDYEGHLQVETTFQNDDALWQREYFTNGKLKEEGALSNGVQTGTWKYWSPEGKLLEIKNYPNGEETGTKFTVMWHPDGIQCHEGVKINETFVGKWTSWSEYKKIIKHEIYHDEMGNQLKKVEYDRQGRLTEVSYYYNNSHFVSTDYEKGIKHLELIFEPNSSMFLQRKILYANNIHSMEEIFHNEKSKTINYYNEKGLLIKTEAVENGKTTSTLEINPPREYDKTFRQETDKIIKTIEDSILAIEDKYKNLVPPAN